MRNKPIDIGRQILENLSSNTSNHPELISRLVNFNVDWSNSEELYSWFVSVIALSAVHQGNFGVGAAIVSNTGSLICYSENAVFKPRFRSDAHAEMMVINQFESSHFQHFSPSSCTLYTSLESCPMCLARTICSQIGYVLHVVDDSLGGMTRQRDSLPPIWKELQSKQIYRKADCSETLSRLSLDVFQCNVTQLNNNIINR